MIRLANSFVCHINCFCSRHAPRQFLLASHFILVSLSTLKCFVPLFWVFVFMLLNVSVCFCSHSLMLFGVVVFSIFNNGRTVSEIWLGYV